MVAWIPGSFTVNIVAVSGQFIHCHIIIMSGMSSLLHLVYAFNDSHQRMELQRYLINPNTQEPWILCGDFNYVMAFDETIGVVVRHSDIFILMLVCMSVVWIISRVLGICSLGITNSKEQLEFFTKLNRVLANIAWHGYYTSAEVWFRMKVIFII